MKHPFPIMWYEGMPLDPIVFQQDFLYHESKLNYLLKNLQPNAWGITKLEWDNVYLADGILKIKELECILPDFTCVMFPSTASDELEIKLKDNLDLFKTGDKFVFLTLPENHLAYVSTIAKPRYTPLDIDNMKDLTNSDSESSVSFLQPICSLYVADSPPTGTICIPLAKIRFTGVSFQFTSFAAPTMKISKSQELLQQIEGLVSTGRNKLKYLINKHDGSADTKLMIANLANIIFPLERIVKSDEGPYAIFAHLVDHLGNTLIFLDDDNIPSVPQYNHLDHISSIQGLLSFTNATLEKIKEPYKQYMFAEKDGIFGIMLPESATNTLVIGVTKKPNATLDSMISWVNNAIICTEDNLTRIQDQRIMGAKREYIKYSKTLDVKATQDMILLNITLEPTYITSRKMLCIMSLDTTETPENISCFIENI